MLIDITDEVEFSLRFSDQATFVEETFLQPGEKKLVWIDNSCKDSIKHSCVYDGKRWMFIIRFLGTCQLVSRHWQVITADDFIRMSNTPDPVQVKFESFQYYANFIFTD